MEVSLKRLTDRIVVLYLLTSAILLVVLGDGIQEWWTFLLAHLLAALLILRARQAQSRLRGLPAFAFNWYPVIAFPLLYKEVELLARAIGNWGLTGKVQAWERLVFGGYPSDWLSRQLPWSFLSEYLHACYLSYLFLIPGVAGYFYFRGKSREFQEVILLLSAIMATSYLFYILFPVDSPFYLSAPLDRPLSEGTFYRIVHFFSDRGGARGGAFPSTHVSISTAVWLVCWRRDRKAALWLGLLVPGIYVATVYGRFHYVLDVFAGWLWAGAAFVTMYVRFGAGSRLSDSGSPLARGKTLAQPE